MNPTTEKPPLDHASSTSDSTERIAHGLSCREEVLGRGREPMLESCPMARMCMGMRKHGAWGGRLMLLPGALLIAGGLVVILVPEVLAWLLGGAAILMGVLFLFMASFMRRAFDWSEPGTS